MTLPPLSRLRKMTEANRRTRKPSYPSWQHRRDWIFARTLRRRCWKTSTPTPSTASRERALGQLGQRARYGNNLAAHFWTLPGEYHSEVLSLTKPRPPPESDRLLPGNSPFGFYCGLKRRSTPEPTAPQASQPKQCFVPASAVSKTTESAGPSASHLPPNPASLLSHHRSLGRSGHPGRTTLGGCRRDW